MPPSRLFMFGPARLERDDPSAPNLDSRKALAVLCYLVARRERLARPHLVDLFWGDMPEERGRHNLRRVLSNIGACLPGWLDVDRYSVQYTPGADTWVDLIAVEELRAAATPGALAAAVDMLRGEFLADLALDGCPEFETWLVIEREHWRQRTAEMLTRLMEIYVETRDYSRARAFAERFVALDPWREEAHRELMRVLALTGERNAALAAYDACRRILADELGAEPTSETQALRDQIFSGEVGVRERAVQPSHNLPAPLTPLVGREDELAELLALLDKSSGNRLVTIVGLGGTGKTRLALEVAHGCWRNFADGAAFVSLESVTGPESVLSALATALSFRYEGPSDPRTQLLDYLRTKDLLLVLDGFENVLAGGADLIVDILRNAAGVKALVASREPLHLRAECVFDVAGLPFPQTDDGEPAGHSAAVRLFVQGAQRARRRFAASPATLPAIVEICRALQGLPLGLELAAALVATQSCQDIARQITDDLDTLATTMRDIPAAHRSLRAVFEHSWRLLTSQEQEVLTALAVFRGGFEQHAAAHVAGASAALLVRLVSKSLLSQHDDDGEMGEPRYDMHALVRQYALEKLSERNLYDSVLAHYLDFYVAFAEASETELIGADQALWWRRVTVEQDNVRHALRWGTEHDPSSALRLAGALWRFWFERCYYEEGCSWLARALAHDVGGNARARAKALFGASRMAHAQGNIDKAWLLLEEGLPLARQSGDLGLRAFTASDLGWRRYERGERDSAKALWAEALRCAEQADNRWLVAVVTASLGEVALNQGDPETGQRRLAQSVDLARQIGDVLLLAFHLALLARALTALGDWAGASACLLESLDLRYPFGNRANIAACLEGLAAVAAAESRPPAASWGAQLLGAAESLRDAVQTPVPPVEYPAYAATLQALRSQLGSAEFEGSWTTGRAMTLEAAIAAAHAKPN